MFAVNLIVWLTRANELLVDDDALVTVNDVFTRSLAGTIADALTAGCVERKARWGGNPQFESQLVHYRTVVRALRMIERDTEGREAFDGVAVSAVTALVVEQQLDDNSREIAARVLARAELGLSDKTDW